MNAGRYFFGQEPNKQSFKNFQAAEELDGKKKTIFWWEFIVISICDWLFLCVLISFEEMFIKRA